MFGTDAPLVEGAFIGEGMLGDELRRLLIHASDVSLELGSLDTPLASSADLDGPQIASTNERIGLRGGDAEDLGEVGERDESRLFGHGVSVPQLPCLLLVTQVCGVSQWFESKFA